MKRLITCLLLTIYIPTSFASDAAVEFGARRWPSEPTLSVDLQPDLCKKIRDAAVAAFKSVDADIDIASVIGVDFPALKPTAASDATGNDAPSPLGRLDLDLDGTGHQQVVVYRDAPFNWRGDWHYAYVFPSVADFDAAKSQIATAWNSVPQESQYPPPGKREFSAQEYYPTALTDQGEEISTGDVWADHALFEANKRFYFVSGATNFDRQALGPVQVFRLLADGHVKLVCEIGNSNLDKTYQAFAHLPAVGSFLATIRRIGAGGEDTGTLHSGAIHDAQANTAEKRAAYRPWATSAETKSNFVGENPYYRFDERTKVFLEDWSLEELWNRREYQTLMELTGPAEASFASYLQSAFGVSADAAPLDAVRVIQQLIGARLLVPNEFNATQTQLYFPSTPLHDAVMRRSRAAFDAALANPQAAPGHPARSAPDVLSEAVRDAVEWPYALDQLLSAGGDPNRANEFGKTPLMVAAHFDRPDSVRRLLKAGAQVNASTSSGSGMELPKISARTALMYAAENASPATIKALLDAGADPAARDSDGHDVSAYLSRNPRFTAVERSLGVAGLAKAADEFAGPSYSCSKAKTATEQAICGSEVLRILDAQIARAFSALRGKAGPAIAEEQRHWLQSRDRSCSADVDCLAEMMRTHLRALQERINE